MIHAQVYISSIFAQTDNIIRKFSQNNSFNYRIYTNPIDFPVLYNCDTIKYDIVLLMNYYYLSMLIF